MAPAPFSDARHWWREQEADQATEKLQKAVLKKQPLVGVSLHTHFHVNTWSYEVFV